MRMVFLCRKIIVSLLCSHKMVEGLLGTLPCIPLGGERAHRTRLKTEPVTAQRRIQYASILSSNPVYHAMGVWNPIVATTCDLSLLLISRVRVHYVLGIDLEFLPFATLSQYASQTDVSDGFLALSASWSPFRSLSLSLKRLKSL